jgi:hypothetical protein
VNLEERMHESNTDAPHATTLLNSQSLTEGHNVARESSSFAQPRRIDTEQQINGLNNATSSTIQQNNMGDEYQNQLNPTKTTAILEVEGSALHRRPTTDLIND